MAMQQIPEMLGVNIFFSFPPSQLMLTCLWLHRCQQRENYFPAWRNLRRKKKNDGEKDKKLVWVVLFPAVRGKNPLCFVLLSGCDILHHLPSFLSNSKSYGYHTQVFLWQDLAHWGLPAWASSSNSILRASLSQSHSLLRRVSSDFSGANADCLRVGAFGPNSAVLVSPCTAAQ